MNNCSVSRAARKPCRKDAARFYQFVTARTGKAEGNYLGMDFETEVEHGFTDAFAAGKINGTWQQ